VIGISITRSRCFWLRPCLATHFWNGNEFQALSKVRREDNPLVYWLSLAAQFVIFLLFLFTGGKCTSGER